VDLTGALGHKFIFKGEVNIMKLKWLKVLILLLIGGMFASAAWGAGINVHCTGTSGTGFAYDHSGTGSTNKLNTSSVIQWVYGNPGLPDPDETGLLHSGTLFNTYNIGEGTAATAGTFDINTAATSSSRLRVWENGGPAQGNWYKDLGPYAVGDPLPSENNIDNFQTNVLADIPPAPTVNAGGYKLTWDSGKADYLVDFNLTAVKAASPNVGVVSYQIRVRNAADDWASGKTYSGSDATWNIVEDPDDPYFSAGENYVAQAMATNYFGSSPWGTEKTFLIPAGGDFVGGVSSVPITLVNVQDSHGVNKVSVPFAPAYLETTTITTLQDLIDTINGIADAKVVRTLGYWDKNTQAAVGWTFKDDGSVDTKINTTEDPSAVNLVANLPYQIYVTENVGPFTLNSQAGEAAAE
jgi:hypothetical protein